nr:hypothetical protein Iba_chr02bCG13940 [Ipomoea batatas]
MALVKAKAGWSANLQMAPVKWLEPATKLSMSHLCLKSRLENPDGVSILQGLLIPREDHMFQPVEDGKLPPDNTVVSRSLYAEFDLLRGSGGGRVRRPFGAGGLPARLLIGRGSDNSSRTRPNNQRVCGRGAFRDGFGVVEAEDGALPLSAVEV